MEKNLKLLNKLSFKLVILLNCDQLDKLERFKKLSRLK